jgi:hypothetical protein
MRSKLLIAAVVLSLALGLLAACGSSHSTTPRDVRTVAVAEGRFRAEWRQATRDGTAKCARAVASHVEHCRGQVEGPGQRHAMARYSKAVEVILEGGVGAKCAEALTESVNTMSSIPAFAGATTAACRAESQE